LEPSVHYHPLASAPRDFEPEAFAFALAYGPKDSKIRARSCKAAAASAFTHGARSSNFQDSCSRLSNS
jgi:hypothetical protein